MSSAVPTPLWDPTSSRAAIGNDQLVWNQGDGDDITIGDAGNDETEVNGESHGR